MFAIKRLCNNFQAAATLVVSGTVVADALLAACTIGVARSATSDGSGAGAVLAFPGAPPRDALPVFEPRSPSPTPADYAEAPTMPALGADDLADNPVRYIAPD
jgi:hypothetical protein